MQVVEDLHFEHGDLTDPCCLSPKRNSWELPIWNDSVDAREWSAGLAIYIVRHEYERYFHGGSPEMLTCERDMQ